MASSWQKKKAAHPVRADGRMCYLYKKTTEYVRGLVIYQAAFFTAVLPFGPRFLALASSSFLLASYQASNSLKLFNRFVLTRPSVLMNIMKPDFGLIALPPHSRQKALTCASFSYEQGNFTHAKRKSTTEALCPYGAYAFLEIIAQLNDANRVRRCVNVQISASGTIPVESHNFGMRDVSKDIERLIVSRS